MSDTLPVTIFTQPGCPTCVQLKSYLKSHGIEYVERDVSADPSAFAELHERGYAATPLTIVGEREVLGMNRTRLDAILGGRERAAVPAETSL